MARAISVREVRLADARVTDKDEPARLVRIAERRVYGV